MTADKMTQDLIRMDLPRYLAQVNQLQELQEQTASALRIRDEKIQALELQLTNLQNEFLAVTLQQPTNSQEVKFMLLSCLQSTTFSLAHGQKLIPTTQVPVLHALDDLLQEMLDGEVEQKILHSVAVTLGNVLLDTACLLVPSILAAVRSVCTKLALVVAIIPHTMLDEVIPVLCFIGKSSWGTSVLLESNLAPPLLTIIQFDTLRSTIPASTYLKLLTLLYHLLQASGFASMKHQSQDTTFRMFKRTVEARAVEPTQVPPAPQPLSINPAVPDKSETVKSPGAVAYPIAAVDRYGFLLTDKRFSPRTKVEATPHAYDHKSTDAIWLENRRTQKWMAMTGGVTIEDWERTKQKQAAKLKSRVRKGIPDAIRGIAWPHLAGSSTMMKNNPGMYQDLLATPHPPCEETISRDIGRTFPKHHLFKDSSSLGQGALMNVLKAYSVYDPNVGYCQGMGFISALFLSYMPEEQTFWHLVACLNQKKYGMADIYRPGMPRAAEIMSIFEQCTKTYLPKLTEHMDAEGLHPTMYATQWFITLYSYSFPFEFVTRVWDIFLHEGWKIVYRIAIALLKVSEKTLTGMKFEKIMEYFRDLPTSVDTAEVLATAIDIPMTNRQLTQMREAYQTSQAKK
ncbi:Aste57867_20420 [Aphanomyces stellatus]|uniref:Aste57867_20420 protein n=1 Tax=Aphanomyces stellatus TaxID=120398 RepID=A0A485LF29_9STRA|nr:hypothetical protein As57867_020354 [Aphanomyces stellatus]VFT97106.1 Aste57867_20420 [Aphanomyces stellatus]